MFLEIPAFLTRILILLGIGFGLVMLYFIITEGPKEFFKAFFQGVAEGLLRGILQVLAVILLIILIVLFILFIYHLGSWIFTGEF